MRIIMHETLSAMNKSAIGRRFKDLREKRKMSQEELAGESGVARRVIQMLEKGEGNPTLESLEAIAQAMDFPIDEALKRDAKEGDLPEFSSSAKILSELEQSSTDFQRLILRLLFDDKSYTQGRPKLVRLEPAINMLLKLRRR